MSDVRLTRAASEVLRVTAVVDMPAPIARMVERMSKGAADAEHVRRTAVPLLHATHDEARRNAPWMTYPVWLALRDLAQAWEDDRRARRYAGSQKEDDDAGPHPEADN